MSEKRCRTAPSSFKSLQAAPVPVGLHVERRRDNLACSGLQGIPTDHPLTAAQLERAQGRTSSRSNSRHDASCNTKGYSCEAQRVHGRKLASP